MGYVDSDMEDLNLPSVIPVDSDYGRYAFDSEESDDDIDESSAYSVASSMYNFRVENGRRYTDYKTGHPFPHDEVAEENEKCMHAMINCLLNNKNFLAPIDESDLHCVADVGTGLGLWVESVAERYPDTEVVGFDLIPHERPTHPNCTYIVTDVTEEWVLDRPDMKFDLIHMRSLFAAITDWPHLYKQCFDNIRSGGWIEQLEIEIDCRADDDSNDSNNFVKSLARYSLEMTRAAGRDFGISTGMKKMIEEAGFVDVQEHKLKLPLGPWSTDPKMKEVGKFFERYYKTGIQGWLLHVCTRTMGWTVDQVNQACINAFQEINGRKYHNYFPLVIVVGRKP